MPTTSLGITFPCESDVITSGTWNTFAQGVDAAITASINLGNVARLPNYVRVRNVLGQNFNVGVITATTYDTEAFDRGNFFNPGTPTILTLPANGSYLVASRVSRFADPATLTSHRIAILVNGVEFAYHKEQSATSPNVSSRFGASVLLPARTAGDQVVVNQLITGVGVGQGQTDTYIVQVANV